LQTGSFSVLTKPIDAGEAVKSVRLALWQNRLLKLIASREKALAAFREHIKKFPEDWKGEELFARSLALMERTLTALGTSLQRMEETHDPYLFDIAVSIDLRSRQRALDRLFRLASEGAVH